MTCTSFFQACARELAQRLELGELRLVARVGEAAGPQAVAQRVADVVLRHDLA